MIDTTFSYIRSSVRLKKVLEPLRKRGFVFKRFEPFSLLLIGSRKRIDIFHGVDICNRYVVLFSIKRKSRVLVRDIEEWLELKRGVESYFGYPILINLALIDAPLCSKALKKLESEGWKVISV